MKRLAEDAMLDDNGLLYLMAPGVIDPFDPPGSIPPRVWKSTGYTFEDVPTYGWPLGVIYQNNSLQFATVRTAEMMRAECSARFSGYTWSVGTSEVKVGPFRWAPVRQVKPYDKEGLIVALNAGELASQLARYPESWQAQIARSIRSGVANRDRED